MSVSPHARKRSSWQGSNRRERLPANWDTLRRLVLERDEESCTWLEEGEGSRLRCGKHANQCDHIRPGDDHSMSNLRALCEFHHAKQSGRQGAAAFHKQRRETRQRFNAPRQESHPGLAKE